MANVDENRGCCDDGGQSPIARQGDSAHANAWRLWLALTEQSARSELLEARIVELQNSRSWRLTAPLRRMIEVLRRWRGFAPERPPLAAPGTGVDGPSLHQLPMCVAPAASNEKGPRLLVDVTELALEDLGAGVQRVTRRLLAELLFAPPIGYRVETVRLSKAGRYVLARQFLAEFAGLPAVSANADAPVLPRPGDIFLGLDHCRDRAEWLGPGLSALVEAGVQVNLLVHDVLPLSHPEWFPTGVHKSYESWLRVATSVPCRVVCVSQYSKAELLKAIQNRGLSPPAQGIEAFTLGSDLLPAVPIALLPPRDEAVVRVLMVGTVEPRKGHAQALSAVEALWSQGVALELILVGRVGWHVENLASRLRQHPEYGRRLHWIEDADDRALASLYAECDLLLMASFGEGFGLPIVEAGRAGLGLLLRDLPVFREVAGDAAQYFAGDDGDIEVALKAWHERSGTTSTSVHPWVTWAQSAEALKRTSVPASVEVCGQQPSRTEGQEYT